MGKYVIESKFENTRCFLEVACENREPYFFINRVDSLTPYTEPDLEQVRKEAYQQGYEQGYKDGYNEPGKGKIQAGDEVKCIRAGWTAIVTKIKGDGYLTLMGNDGEIANGYDEKDFIKTGRRFPEIAEVLRKMRENNG